MAASTPVPLGSYGPTMGPVLANMPGTRFVFASFNIGTYATGGIDVVLPSPQDGATGKLVAIILINPYDIANGRYFSWNNSTTDPEIDADVISTGTEVGAVDLSGYVLQAMFVFQD